MIYKFHMFDCISFLVLHLQFLSNSTQPIVHPGAPQLPKNGKGLWGFFSTQMWQRKNSGFFGWYSQHEDFQQSLMACFCIITHRIHVWYIYPPLMYLYRMSLWSFMECSFGYHSINPDLGGIDRTGWYIIMNIIMHIEFSMSMVKNKWLH